MSKGDRVKSNREAKKPKKEKLKTNASAPSTKDVFHPGKSTPGKK